MSLGEAQVPIRATLDKLDGDLNKARGKIDGAVKNLQKLGKFSLAGVTAGVAALGAGVAIMGKQIMEGVDSLMRIERIGAQTEAVIKSTGGAAGLTAQQITEMADSMEALTATEAESTQEAANMLLTFTSIGQDVFPEALQAVVDMGRALDKTGEGAIDMSSQALMIGKALQDPIQGMTALRRVGVNFNEAAVETVQAMVDIGDIAGAQKFILEELATEFGGSGEAFAQTTAGMREAMLHNLGSIQEALAGPFLTIAGTVFGRLSEIMTSPEVTEAISAITGAIENLMAQLENGIDPITAIVGFLGQLIFAFGGTSEQVQALNWAVWGVVNAVQSFVAQAQTVLAPIFEAIAGFVSWQDVLIALGIAIASVVLPAIWGIITAIAPVIAIFAVVVAATAVLRNAWENNWGGIQEKTQAVIQFIQGIITSVMSAVQSFWAANGDAILAKAREIWDGIKSAIDTTIKTVQAIIQAVTSQIQSSWDAHGSSILSGAQQVWDSIKNFIDATINLISNIIQTTTAAIQAFWSAHGEAILTFTQGVWDAIMIYISAVMQQISTALDTFAALFRGDWQGFLDGIKELWANAWDAIVQIVSTIWAAISPLLSSMWASLSSWFMGKVGEMASIGSNLITALADAISSRANSYLKRVAQGVAALLPDWVKAILGIASPSRVFMSIGFDVGEGLAVGIEDTTRRIERAMSQMVGTLDIRAPRYNLDDLSPALAVSGSLPSSEPSISQSRSMHVENIFLPNVTDGRGLLEELEEMTIG